MIKRVRFLLCAIMLAVVWALPLPVRAAVTRQSIAVPMYEYPTIGTFWDDITDAGGGSVPFVITNPASGPGTSVDPIYTSEIAENTADNIRSIGYVYSDYQDRPFQQVLNDIDTWYQLYPGISGIFIDLVEDGGAAEQCYIAALHNHVKNTKPNDLVILNPGTNISSAYEPYGDIFLNAENTYAAYSSSWNIQHPGFEDNPAYQNRFWQILHTVSGANYANALNLLRTNNAGWVYITDDVMPNPYRVTPSYWLTEVAGVGSLPASSIPNRGKTTLPSGCISLSVSAQTTYDTTVSARTVAHSNVTVTNTSSTYASEPTTKVELIHIPSGASVTGLSGSSWSCNAGNKTCTYGAALGTSSTAPAIASTIETDCSYGGGNATARLTNFAGNTWEITLPLEPPGNCDASTPSGSKKKKAPVTTAGTETTPSTQTEEKRKGDQPGMSTNRGPSAPKAKARADSSRLSSRTQWLVGGGIVVLVLIIGGVLLRRRRRQNPW